MWGGEAPRARHPHASLRAIRRARAGAPLRGLPLPASPPSPPPGDVRVSARLKTPRRGGGGGGSGGSGGGGGGGGGGTAVSRSGSSGPSESPSGGQWPQEPRAARGRPGAPRVPGSPRPARPPRSEDGGGAVRPEAGPALALRAARGTHRAAAADAGRVEFQQPRLWGWGTPRGRSGRRRRTAASGPGPAPRAPGPARRAGCSPKRRRWRQPRRTGAPSAGTGRRRRRTLGTAAGQPWGTARTGSGKMHLRLASRREEGRELSSPGPTPPSP